MVKKQGGKARYLDGGGRLAEAPSQRLVSEAFSRELNYAASLWDGISYADLAHVLMLIEQGIVPKAAGRTLLGALVELHDDGIEGLSLDAKWGDLYNNRDAELQRRIGNVAGWLHAGRARREALTIAWLIRLRSDVVDLVAAGADFARGVSGLAGRQVATLMPDFTYLQHAQPTLLGHYLLGYVAPVLRDLERLVSEFAVVNESPAGSASTNGSRLPLNRERMRELLGFDALTLHDRDAMWRTDVPMNISAISLSLATTAERLAEELQIWATSEFAFVELADRHCRTSVIMPNKKNPYVLSFIRGQAREMTGQYVSVVATNQTPSGQIDNRNTSYEIVPKMVSNAAGLLRLLTDALTYATFDVTRLGEQAREGHTYGTDLSDMLLQREQIDSRRAHEIVGAFVMRRGKQSGDDFVTLLPDIFRAATGREMTCDAAELERDVRPERIVAARRGVGSCSVESIEEMCSNFIANADALELKLANARTAVEFPDKLRSAVSERIDRDW